MTTMSKIKKDTFMSGELEMVEEASCLQVTNNLLWADTFEKFW